MIAAREIAEVENRRIDAGDPSRVQDPVEAGVVHTKENGVQVMSGQQVGRFRYRGLLDIKTDDRPLMPGFLAQKKGVLPIAARSIDCDGPLSQGRTKPVMGGFPERLNFPGKRFGFGWYGKFHDDPSMGV